MHNLLLLNLLVRQVVIYLSNPTINTLNSSNSIILNINPNEKWTFLHTNCFICAAKMFIFQLIIEIILRITEVLWGLLWALYRSIYLWLILKGLQYLCFIKADWNKYILSKLNSFHKDIQLTVEVEREDRISILYPLVIRDNSNIKTRVLLSILFYITYNVM